MSHTIAGFRFGAVAAQIRKDGRSDVALAVADRAVPVAAVFTRNRVRAAPVLVAEERVRAGKARALLVNSGCANACTGQPGLEATLRTTEAVARALGAQPEEVLPASTGVIGAVLPADKLIAQVEPLLASLTPDGHDGFARAILTTDRWPKLERFGFAAEGGKAELLGIAKGAGMIHPDMGPPHATMLAFLFTDAVAEPGDLARALGPAVDRTFNSCSVDGDTSTNDCVIVMASGATGHRASPKQLEAAMEPVCDALARSMVSDGEGASHVVELRVGGLDSDAEARVVARTVATSLLVKTALHGKDPNWGRLIAAAGRAGVPFDPEHARIVVEGVEVVRNGLSVGSDAEARAAARMRAPSYVVELLLGRGAGTARYLTCDLGHEYVDVNAGYRT